MRLLALRLSALGDVIHTIPAVIALREAGADVSWVVEAPYAEMVEIVSGARPVRVSMKTWGRRFMASRPAMRSARLEMRGHDASVDFQGLVKSAVLGWLSRSPVRYGFDRAAVRERASLMFTNKHVAVDLNAHVIEMNLHLASAVIPSREDGEGSPAHKRASSGRGGSLATLGMTAHWERFLATGFDPYRGKVVLLPGAGKANKQWPVERFAEVAKKLGDRALAVWGPNEEELARAIGAPMAPRTNLRELATILKLAEVVIAGDTGPLHLAAALGTRVIGLYGPTNPRRNGPYGQLENVISTWDGSRSMEGIEVGAVMKSL